MHSFLPDGETRAWFVAVLRWIHVILGVAWIGGFYLFHFLVGPALSRLDPETRRKTAPGLVSRVLAWNRAASAATWGTGFLLFLAIYPGQSVMYADPAHERGLSDRTIWILAGALFGTVMALQIWLVIAPAQERILAAVAQGGTPDIRLKKRASRAARINVYLSVPLLLTMVSHDMPVLLGKGPLALAGLVLAGWALVWAAHRAAFRDRGRG
ncbi:MAG: urate hydroxylase PuuD [Planctomycetota bacterium]